MGVCQQTQTQARVNACTHACAILASERLRPGLAFERLFSRGVPSNETSQECCARPALGQKRRWQGDRRARLPEKRNAHLDEREREKRAQKTQRRKGTHACMHARRQSATALLTSRRRASAAVAAKSENIFERVFAASQTPLAAEAPPRSLASRSLSLTACRNSGGLNSAERRALCFRPP